MYFFFVFSVQLLGITTCRFEPCHYCQCKLIIVKLCTNVNVTSCSVTIYLIIERIIMVMTKFQHQRDLLAFTMVKNQKQPFNGVP